MRFYELNTIAHTLTHTRTQLPSFRKPMRCQWECVLERPNYLMMRPSVVHYCCTTRYLLTFLASSGCINAVNNSARVEVGIHLGGNSIIYVCGHFSFAATATTTRNWCALLFFIWYFGRLFTHTPIYRIEFGHTDTFHIRGKEVLCRLCDGHMRIVFIC